MVIYPDTSFLFSLYVSEPDSAEAGAYADRVEEGLAFTPFHRLELRTALRNRAYRKEIDFDELRRALHLSDGHVAAGFLKHTPLNWSDTMREAEQLGAAHLLEIGARSGDLFHVASAVVLGAKEFLTFDDRQHALARRAGLKVKAWKRVK